MANKPVTNLKCDYYSWVLSETDHTKNFSLSLQENIHSPIKRENYEL